MVSKYWLWKATAALVVIILLAGCQGSRALPEVTLVPTIGLQPTLDAVSTQAARTVVADLTKNAPTATPLPPTSTVAPTATGVPSFTPLPTFTPLPPTATFVPWTVTPAVTATSIYACTINLAEPAFAADFPPNAPFDGKWTVTNNGSATWTKGTVDFKYVSGTKFQEKVDSLDLSADVAKGQSVTEIIDMLAPKNPGRYSATWAFVEGSTTLCSVGITIDVK